jgi:hypothetical protein
MADAKGEIVGTWGETYFEWPHGISITHDDCVLLCDIGLHVVSKFSSDGKLIMELGTKGKPSDTGRQDWVAFWQVKRSAGPFNMPTHAIEAPWGDIYVTDGYGNARVHVFSSDGELKFSWGEPGSAPGEFKLPHGLAVDEEGYVYVADRENLRIQVFCKDGKFIRQWNNIERPAAICQDRSGNFFIAEMSEHGKLPGVDLPQLSPTPGVRILNRNGDTLATIGRAPENSLCCKPGYFAIPHSCYVDAEDNLYVGEPIQVVAEQDSLPLDCHVAQKLVRTG